MNIIFSNHQLGAVEACHRAEALRFRAMLRRNTQKSVFMIGSFFHTAMAAHYSGQDAMALMTEDIKGERNKSSNPEGVSLAGAEAKRLVQWYLETSPEQDAAIKLSPFAVENKFSIPIADNAHLVGIIDLVANACMDGPQSSLGIIDHKTASSCGDGYFYGSEYDSQYLLYCHAARTLGFTIDWFAWFVTVKTKTPRSVRHWLPVNWKRVDSYINRLQLYANHLEKLPEDIDDILLIPGNPAQCRRCAFRDMCDYPDNAKWIAENEFHRADYREFLGED